MTKLNIDNKDHKFRELLTYWRKIIAERLRRRQYYEDPRYGTIVLTRREFLKLLASLGIAGAIASLGIGMFNAHWLWAQETTNPPPTPSEYNYGELNWLELTVKGTPLGEKLFAEYLFFEGAGTIIHDSSGNNYHGTLKSGNWVYLPNGKFVIFRPTIELPFTSKDIGQKFSIELVIKPTHSTTPNDGSWRGLITNFSYNAFGFGLVTQNIDRNRLIFVTFYLGGHNAIWFDDFTYYFNKWISIVARFAVNLNQDLHVNLSLKGWTITPTKYNVGNYTTFVNDGGVDPYLTVLRFFKDEITSEEMKWLYKLDKVIIPELP